MVAASAWGPFHTVSAESDEFNDEKYREGSVTILNRNVTILNRNKTVPFRAASLLTAAVIAPSPVSADDEQAGGPIKDGYGRKIANGNNPADMAGGIHFFNQTDRTRTITIGDVFDKIDGIDKDDRVRYDLPEFGR